MASMWMWFGCHFARDGSGGLEALSALLAATAVMRISSDPESLDLGGANFGCAAVDQGVKP
jgi:hypothetical protein